ncbi:MAG: hypothetical protein HY791_18715 [Deltaproteobacteria bacterium]|nr:hypothetical protein [Deltaproteobacteria bacterium]
MEHIAHEVRALDVAFATQPTDRKEVIARLRALEGLAAELSRGGLATNHPELDRNLPAFQEQLTAARVAAEADPPNDFLAGSVSGLCRYCHR